MPDKLRQDVARAICDYMAVDPDFLDGDGNPYWMEYTGEADAAIAVIRESLAPTLAALQPFADFANDRVPSHMRITEGSMLAKRQLTMGDCQNAKRSLDASPLADSALLGEKT